MQLDRASGPDARRRVILLADLTVAVAEGAIGAATARDVVAIVRAGEGSSLRHPAVSFDGVEPGGVRRGPHGVDVQAAEHRQEARMIMDIVQVIHDDEEAFARVARPHAPKGLAHLDDPLAAPEQATQAVGMDVGAADGPICR
jgi:hypothetical protein